MSDLVSYYCDVIVVDYIKRLSMNKLFPLLSFATIRKKRRLFGIHFPRT